MKKSVGTTAQPKIEILKAYHWWHQAPKRSQGLRILSAENEPVKIGRHTLVCQDALDDVHAAVVWRSTGAFGIGVAYKEFGWLPTVALWHELGHLHTTTDEMLQALLLSHRYPFTYRQHFLRDSEINAWKWAKHQIASDWDDKAEAFMTKCLASYGIHNVQIL